MLLANSVPSKNYEVVCLTKKRLTDAVSKEAHFKDAIISDSEK